MLKMGDFFSALSFLFSFSVIVCVVFALGGIFNPLWISLFLIISCLTLAKLTGLFSFNRNISRWELLAFMLATGWCLFVVLGFNISYLGGRDNGAMVEASIMLAQNQKLTFAPPVLDFLHNQNSNQLALNYPGFILTKDNQLRTQFNLGYVSYLAFWFSLFGEWGLKFANLPGLFIGLLAVFYLAKSGTKNPIWGLAAMPLVAFSFPFFWHARQNLAETTAFGLLLAFVYNFFLYQKNKGTNFWFLVNSFLALLAFSLVRMEGIFLAIILLAYLFYTDRAKDFILFKSRRFWLLILGSGLFWGVYSLNILPFCKKMIKDILGYSSFNESILGLAPFRDFLPKVIYVFRIFENYQLLPLLILGLIFGLLVVARFLTKKPLSLPEKLVFIFLGPFLIYLIKPNISLDHPWILRRYMFAVIPFLTLGTVFVFARSAKRFGSLAIFLSAIILAPSLALFFRYGTIKENPLLKQELAELAAKFQPGDLILIDKSVSPNSWSLVSEPLRFVFNLNAVYIYKATDLALIPRDQFPRAFLLASPEAALDYGPYLSQKKSDFLLTFSQLKILPFNKETDFKKPIILPTLVEQKMTGVIYEIKQNE